MRPMGCRSRRSWKEGVCMEGFATGDDAALRKSALRKQAKDVRRGLGDEERSAADLGIAGKVLMTPEWGSARLVLTYLSFGTEVETRRLISLAWAARKTVAIPWCVPGTRDMRWFRVAPPDLAGHSGLDDLVRSRFGVEEPVPDDTKEVDPNGGRAIALVPGLTFDLRGYRLGYGGGFYDTFLSTFKGRSVGLCREAQLCREPGGLEALGVIDSHDLPVDVVVTESSIMRR